MPARMAAASRAVNRSRGQKEQTLEKAPDAFRTISEVAEEISVPQHVLRFWESRFTQIKPLKRGGGRRYYRPDDVDLLRGVRHLLYGEGYTIRGVQRILREEGLSFVQEVWRVGAEQPSPELDEDDDDGASDVQASARSQEPSFFGGADDGEISDDNGGRREPSLAPPAAAARRALDAGSEGRRKLQTALDDLIACRSLIEAALADTLSPDDHGDEAS
jgi:DNA-binding transcriptional MerR regulator